MQNVIMIILAALAAVLYFSPDTLLSDPQNDVLKKVKDNAQLVALACAAGAGYLYYQSTQTSRAARATTTSTQQSSAPDSELPTYEQSVRSQQ